MEKQPGRLAAGASWVVVNLLIFLLYDAFSESSFEVFDSRKYIEESSGRDGLGRMDEVQSMELNLRRLVRGKDRARLEATGFSCHTDKHSELCIASKPVRFDTQALTLYLPSDLATESRVLIKPYPRKQDPTAMKLVKPVQILIQGRTTNLPSCDFNHDIPSLVFSSGGYTGNLFHELNDIIIPLFITSRHFRSRVRFLITDYNAFWVQKYGQILKGLSDFEVTDASKNKTVHCFPSAVIGLKYHDNLALNYTDIPGGYSILDFRQFLWESYNLKVNNMIRFENKPVLVLISRRRTRSFLNEGAMVKMMKELGFRVHVVLSKEMSNLDKFSHVMNSCNVLVGAHGAGLTNELFLPSGAVVVQVVPLGLEQLSKTYYAKPARKMGLRYFEYKVQYKESSLSNVYGPKDPIITNPELVFSKGYMGARAIYLDGQNMRINLTRFRHTLIRVLDLLGHSPS